MPTTAPSELELLLLQKVRDKTPIMRHFPGDDRDENLREEEIKVELYRDGYAIYYMTRGRKNRALSYMAFLRFENGFLNMDIQLKLWQFSRGMMIYLALIFITTFAADFWMQSIAPTIIFGIACLINLLLLPFEKRKFQRRIDNFLIDLQHNGTNR